MQVAIFPQKDNLVSVLIPAPEFANQLEAVAAKDIPAGTPWRIIDDSELPSRDTRDRWRWTENGPLAIEELT